MGLLDRVISNVVSNATREIGRSVGNAVGNVAGTVTNQAAENWVTDMQVKNEQKKMAVEEERKALNLPPNCPHCGGPTTGKLVCEYCKCKVVQ